MPASDAAATEEFSALEIETLKKFGIVIFAERVIFEAQPPMSEEDLRTVQSQCAGPIPPQLLELWSVTAGGALDYDLMVNMNGREEAISWTELFHNQSDNYHTLQGWIEHELELLESAEDDESSDLLEVDESEETGEVDEHEEEEEEEEEDDDDDDDDDEEETDDDIVDTGKTDHTGNNNRIAHRSEVGDESDDDDFFDDEDESDMRLGYLPFGGFEYCDRIYATVLDGDSYGEIIAWKQGLPRAWEGALHQDAIGVVGANLYSAFEKLCLHEDPLSPLSDIFTGQTFLNHLKELVDDHNLDKSLAEKLVSFYRKAVVDWKTPLDSGRLEPEGRVAKIAVGYAISANDSHLLERLLNAGVNPNSPFEGMRPPVVSAFCRNAYDCVVTLLGRKATVPPEIFTHIDDAVPENVVQLLLQSGATPKATAVAACVACGSFNSARLIAGALSAAGADTCKLYEAEAKKLLSKLQKDLSEVQAGRLAHYLGESGLKARIDNIKTFTL